MLENCVRFRGKSKKMFAILTRWNIFVKKITASSNIFWYHEYQDIPLFAGLQEAKRHPTGGLIMAE